MFAESRPSLDLELLRPGAERDIRPLAELWVQAFPGDRTAAERERELREGGTFGGLESCWVAERNGRMVAALRAYALAMHMHGGVLPAMGLAAVAVAPDHRRRGLGCGVCGEALRIAYARGDVLSALYPFRASFYRALGYTLAGELHRYRFPPRALPEYDEHRFVRAALRVDRDAIAEVYERVACSLNGMLVRLPKMWAFLDDARWYAFVYDAGGAGIRGYVVVRHRLARRPEARALQVKELLAEDEEAYRGLLGWLAAQRDQWPRVIYDALPEECFAGRLSHPRTRGTRPARGLWFETARVLRGPMLRIVNVERALRALDGPLPETLTVRDGQLPPNEGEWRLGAGRVERTSAGAADPATVPPLSIAELTARYLAWRPGCTLAATRGAGGGGAPRAPWAPHLRPPRSFLFLETF